MNDTDILEELDDLCDWIMLRCDMIDPYVGNTVIALEVIKKLENLIRKVK